MDTYPVSKGPQRRMDRAPSHNPTPPPPSGTEGLYLSPSSAEPANSSVPPENPEAKARSGDLHRPDVLAAGGRRLVQQLDSHRATLVTGTRSPRIRDRITGV